LDVWFHDPTLFGSTLRVSYNQEAFQTVAAGQFRATSPTASWLTYCTDLKNPLSAGLFTAIPIEIATNPFHQNPDWVVGGIQRATAAVAFFGPTVSNAAEASALQGLVWESLYDTDLNPAAGAFRIQGDTSLISSWLTNPTWEQTSIVGAPWWQPVNYLLEYRPAQGLIGEPIPEASTWSAIAFGALVIAWAVWRRAK